MVKKTLVMIALAASAALTSAQGPAARGVAVGDWPDARGPNRDGISKETGLPEKWALNGQNFLWRVPYGGRSAPIVMGNRVYVQNPSGRGPDLQERVMALDADTGKVVWEYKFNIFQSDVPPHRVGWASPAADPETGNIYVMGVGATVIALNKDGKRLWDRSIGEEFAAFTTHGGRTMSPVRLSSATNRCRRFAWVPQLEIGALTMTRSPSMSGDIVRPPCVVNAANSSPIERSQSRLPSLLSAITVAPTPIT